VKVRSADPRRKPAVTYNMLSTQSEMDEMIDAVLRAREIAAAPAREKVVSHEITPGAAIRTREEIAAWVRTTAEHTYHPSCTARIGTPENGVVDPELRVHGVQALRIADTSVMPTVIRGNTNAPAMMIGERCAEFVRNRVRSPAWKPTESLA
jgi:choline dehydrogenase